MLVLDTVNSKEFFGVVIMAKQAQGLVISVGHSPTGRWLIPLKDPSQDNGERTPWTFRLEHLPVALHFVISHFFVHFHWTHGYIMLWFYSFIWNTLLRFLMHYIKMPAYRTWISDSEQQPIWTTIVIEIILLKAASLDSKSPLNPP